ncbi:hypothetical protein MNO08_09620 [Pseudomonas simiae]|uniref:hypothetical protein n=1 Tax=Pseudomonas simiae TaxID=321846 RepID=UPI001F52F5B8|nr:hypothetical protein [Pseudomonas simiae]UNK68323.1 hypothetical protein MNO08_09620 [Pseudomonas simiae]
MSEVKRWKLKGFLPGVEGECKAVFQPTVVMAEDFDNATRLFLDAAERCVASERREKELQRRLTAADERADVLEGLLWEYVDRGEVTNEWARDWLLAVTTALKPAEGRGDE